MRLKRIYLLTFALLVLSGCSASRKASHSDALSQEHSPVPLPMRHADEYDSGPAEYEFSPEERDRRPVPPPVPMREPLPAPPAIGVSRVKSVSWFKALRGKSDDDCVSEECGDPCVIGQHSQLPPDYFDSCTNQPATTPHCAGREKLTVFEIMRSWNLGWKKNRWTTTRSRQPGERVVPDPGCSTVTDRTSSNGCTTGGCTTGGCTSAGPRPMAIQHNGSNKLAESKVHHGSRGSSLADPINEFGWENPTVTNEQQTPPDALLELPAKSDKVQQEKSPRTIVPKVPTSEAVPLNPTIHPDKSPAVPESAEPRIPAVPPTSSDSVRTIIQPPLWPKLTGPSAQPVTHPSTQPVVPVDTSLPIIVPGHRI